MFSRYAIYFVPDGAWGDMGAQWLGWDSRTGEEVSAGSDLQSMVTDRPRKYGFHATIKPPFRLADGKTAAELSDATRALCGTLRPFELESLQLSQIGKFFALIAPMEQPALRTVADSAVRDLDSFRAPLSEADLVRRRAAGLSERQEALLQDWGYPYVMEEFKFHLTLSGPVAAQPGVRNLVAEAVVEALEMPLWFDGLCLLGEAEDGRFTVIERFAFEG